MKKYTLLFLAFFLFINVQFAQPKPGPGTPPAPSSGGAPGGLSPSQIQAGYHYYLKENRLIQYIRPKNKVVKNKNGTAIKKTQVDSTIIDSNHCTHFVLDKCGVRVKKKVRVDSMAASNDTINLLLTKRVNKVCISQDSTALKLYFHGTETKEQGGMSMESALNIPTRITRTTRKIDFDKDTVDFMCLIIKRTYHISDTTFYISVPFSLGQFGALTIPFQYRFGYGGEVPNNFSLNLNMSVYYGRIWGRTRFYEDPNRTCSNSFMGAVFAGVTQLTLTSSNTTPALPTGTTINDIALTGGVSFAVNLKLFNLGLFAGLDVPSSAARDWDYASLFSSKETWCRPWVGFGIGFNVPMFAPATNQDY